MEHHEKECSFLFSHKNSPEQQRGGGVVGSQEGQLHTLHVSLFMRLYLTGVPCAHCFYQSSGWRCEANVVRPKLKYCSPATPFTPLPVSFRRVWSFIPGLQNIAQCLIQIYLWTMASRDCHWPHSLNMKLPRWPNQSISFPGPATISFLKNGPWRIHRRFRHWHYIKGFEKRNIIFITACLIAFIRWNNISQRSLMMPWTYSSLIRIQCKTLFHSSSSARPDIL